jgi:hypothetical protein
LAWNSIYHNPEINLQCTYNNWINLNVTGDASCSGQYSFSNCKLGGPVQNGQTYNWRVCIAYSQGNNTATKRPECKISG